MSLLLGHESDIQDFQDILVFQDEPLTLTIINKIMLIMVMHMMLIMVMYIGVCPTPANFILGKKDSNSTGHT